MASIKKGDFVKVIAGSHKGKKGKIVEVLRSCDRVRVEGVALFKRHLKPQKDKNHPEGGIVERLGSIHKSNVMIWSESLNRTVRLGVAVSETGERRRTARGRGVTNHIID